MLGCVDQLCGAFERQSSSVFVIASVVSRPVQVMIVAQEAQDRAARLTFQPLSLVLSFGLFQFVYVAFYRRRRQLRVVLLIASALVGIATLVPLVYRDKELLHQLNSVSETYATLRFLLHIVIIGRDSSKRSNSRRN